MLLYDTSFSKNPVFPHGSYDRFDLDAMDETECLHEFRVRCSWFARESLLPPKNESRPDRGIVCGPEKAGVPVSPERYDPQIWTCSTRDQHDHDPF